MLTVQGVQNSPPRRRRFELSCSAAIELNEWKIHIAHESISAIEYRTPEIANALLPSRQKQKKTVDGKRRRKKKTTENVILFNRTWMVVVVHGFSRSSSSSSAASPSMVGSLAFAFCSHTTEHCSLNFETRKITFYQVEYNFASCFFFAWYACTRRSREPMTWFIVVGMSGVFFHCAGMSLGLWIVITNVKKKCHPSAVAM